MDVREQLERERLRLERLRERVETGGLGGNGFESDGLSELSSADQHPADVGTELFERTKEQSILEQLEAQAEDIRVALRKVDEGTYGRCEDCGRPIAKDRLTAMPAARFCLDDQARAERGAI
jgi:RNA polymerase-binding transcription factor DksA